jgi:hypothetical protein
MLAGNPKWGIGLLGVMNPLNIPALLLAMKLASKEGKPFCEVCAKANYPVPEKPKERRQVKTIIIKRKNIHPLDENKYGHWWIEINGNESYGWWPIKYVGVKDTFLGTDGELNGVTRYDGTVGDNPSDNKDPDHGDSADEVFSPFTRNGDERSDEDIHKCLRTFAKSYRGEWRWTGGFGQNCHTFQEAALEHCGLTEQ